jgi:hypothetical protein
VVSELGKSRSLIDRWSAKNLWWERVADFDAYVEKRRLEARLKANDEADERLIKTRRAIQFKGMEALKALDPTTLSPAQLLQYIIEGAKLEKLGLGEPQRIEERRGRMESVVVHDIDSVAAEIGPALAKLMARKAVEKTRGELKVIEGGAPEGSA